VLQHTASPYRKQCRQTAGLSRLTFGTLEPLPPHVLPHRIQ